MWTLPTSVRLGSNQEADHEPACMQDHGSTERPKGGWQVGRWLSSWNNHSHHWLDVPRGDPTWATWHSNGANWHGMGGCWSLQDPWLWVWTTTSTISRYAWKGQATSQNRDHRGWPGNGSSLVIFAVPPWSKATPLCNAREWLQESICQRGDWPRSSHIPTLNGLNQQRLHVQRYGLCHIETRSWADREDETPRGLGDVWSENVAVDVFPIRKAISHIEHDQEGVLGKDCNLVCHRKEPVSPKGFPHVRH